MDRKIDKEKRMKRTYLFEKWRKDTFFVEKIKELDFYRQFIYLIPII